MKFVYASILLGGLFKLTRGSSPAESFGGIKNKLDYERLEANRFIARHNFGKNARLPCLAGHRLVQENQ